MAALDALVKANYLQWDDKSDATKIVILQGWEREVERPKVDSRSTASSSANTDYWTQY
ncbi:hypothetical protein [Paenibacillus xylanexedens]|uniref:hypothetical protein n=1 Tax=Paenibacillus xylanexedens TaxID=528191 RepID=UPI001642E5E2|nr:hypothetical protein [Paenibacillus xylanexedens]